MSRSFSIRSLALVAALGFAGVVTMAHGAPAIAQESACPTTLAVQQLSGTGDTVTQPISVPAGLLTITGSHQGQSNFAVWVYDLNGGGLEFGDSDLVFNEIGAFSGQQLEKIGQTSTLVFEVTADGPWVLDLSVIQ
ncbi:MAG: hypothetical protein ACR2J8_04400 [Thermomicrobiales bacterium]